MPLVLFALKFIIFAGCHSVLAMPSVKERLGKLLGRWQDRYRLCYNVLSGVLFWWLMIGWPSPRVLYFLPGVWSLVCYAAQFAIAVCLYRCLVQTGMAEFLGTARSGETHLATTGFYGVVRHPLYSLSMLFLLLNPVMTLKWLALSIMAIIYFLIGAVIEERRLLRQHGAGYAAYRDSVPMFIPRLR